MPRVQILILAAVVAAVNTFITGPTASAQTLSAAEAAQLIKEKNTVLQQLGEVVAKRQAADKQRVDCEKLLTALREENAKAKKAIEAHSQESARLRELVTNLEASHAAVVKQSAARQDELNACANKLQQTEQSLAARTNYVESLKEKNAERAWVLTWLKNRFPATRANEEFDFEGILEKLGNIEMPAEKIASSGPSIVSGPINSGYLLLKMPRPDVEVCLGGVLLPNNGELYQLVSVPMTDYERTVRLEVGQTQRRLRIHSGRVTEFSAEPGEFFAVQH